MEAATGRAGAASCSTSPPITSTCFAGCWDEVETVAASLGSQATEQDTARLALEMRSGIEVQSFFSFRAGLADYLEFIGERGTLRVDRHAPVLMLGLPRRAATAPACGSRHGARDIMAARARGPPRLRPLVPTVAPGLRPSGARASRARGVVWTASAASRPCWPRRIRRPEPRACRARSPDHRLAARLRRRRGYITGVREGLRAAGDEVRLLTSSVGTAGDGSAEYRAYGSETLVAKAVLQIVNPFAFAAVRRALREVRPDVALREHVRAPVLAGHPGASAACPPCSASPTTKASVRSAPSCCRTDRMCPTRPALVCWRPGCVSLPHWLRDQPRYALIRPGRRVRRVLACSRWMQRVLASNGVSAEHLPLPVPAPGHGFRRAPAEQPIFVFCGRLDAEKGVPLLLRAFARVRADLPGARLRIVGRGAPAGDAGGSDRCAPPEGGGHLPRGSPPREVERELEDAWAPVAPSLWAEPLGLVAIEAIVRGVPVVASASGGLGETVQHGVSGLLFPNGDEAALAERLDAVARGRAFPDHQLPAALVRQVRETYGVATHIGSLRRIFAEIAGSAGAPLLTATE